MSTRLKVEIGVRNTNLRAISMVDSILVIWLDAILPRVKYCLKKRQLRNEAWSTPKFRGWREVKDPTKEEAEFAKNAGGKLHNVCSWKPRKESVSKKREAPEVFSDNARSSRTRTEVWPGDLIMVEWLAESLISFQVASRQNGKRVAGVPRLDNFCKEFCSKGTEMGL